MRNVITCVVDTKIKRVFKSTASVLLIVALALALFLSLNEFTYASDENSQQSTSDLWAITIGDEEILYVSSQEEGEQIIEGLKNYYLSEGSKVLDVQFDPEISVKKVEKSADENLTAQGVSISSVEDAIKQLDDGKVEYLVYVTKEGDSIESIAKEKGISAKKLLNINFGEYDVDETIIPGSYIVIYKEIPYINVKTVEEITSNKSIDYETVYRTTKSMSKGKYKVLTKGVNGTKQLKHQVTKINGETDSSELISSTVVKQSVDKVVLKGTGTVTATKGSTFDFVSGSDVVDYARKFVGNPYRYGGSSLTNGTDCSGFVYSVYKHFGISLPRVGQINVGKPVSLQNVRKGDILFYSGHVAIYAGNGKAVHAVNEGLGIRVTSMYYTGGIYAVRRIVD